MSRSRYRAQAFPRFNRRRLLALTAAGVGVSAAGVAGLSLASENETASASDGAPLVISVRDAKKGTLDIFSGSSKKTVTDKKLAAQLLKAAR
ncbi:hypothetical protein [Actinoplanes regularis]|uniref:Tat (Twin-arginine translocation) pathway signal sequence n=1 Tax=Actinoplanes regularis TaxID=52697 RepID=A0A238Y305_9ACTN|nr:hypothetical protein [Actinoplanes regularis]GIE86238.1 hypothetical protein Are01nite_27180 [Actinoplanes regularis]SNR65400.1 hypothetical protein SAMN06264365_104213 [Actinoplanes regularis]